MSQSESLFLGVLLIALAVLMALRTGGVPDEPAGGGVEFTDQDRVRAWIAELRAEHTQ